MQFLQSSQGLSHCARKSMVAERYVIQEKIGSGAYGSVYSAVDTKSNHIVALKCLDFDPTVDSTKRLPVPILREICIALSIPDSPHICAVHGVIFTLIAQSPQHRMSQVTHHSLSNACSKASTATATATATAAGEVPTSSTAISDPNTVLDIAILRDDYRNDVTKMVSLLFEGGAGCAASYSLKKCWIVLEKMHTDLSSVLLRPLNYPAMRIQYIMHRVCSGVAHLHRYGIAHRDIKPSNILVDRALCDVRITDFSLSCIDSALDIRRKMTYPVVTLWFRPPEVSLGSHVQSAAVDVWSLGIVCLQLFLGVAPYRPNSEVEHMMDTFRYFGTPCLESSFWTLPFTSGLTHDTLPHWPRRRMETIVQSFVNHNKHLRRSAARPCLSVTDQSAMYDFLDQCLQCNPKDRASAEELLGHSFLQGGLD